MAKGQFYIGPFVAFLDCLDQFQFPLAFPIYAWIISIVDKVESSSARTRQTPKGNWQLATRRPIKGSTTVARGGDCHAILLLLGG